MKEKLPKQKKKIMANNVDCLCVVHRSISTNVKQLKKLRAYPIAYIVNGLFWQCAQVDTIFNSSWKETCSSRLPLLLFSFF